MAVRLTEKTHLSARGLLKRVQEVFKSVPDPEKGKGSRNPNIPLADCLMAGLAVFGLKYPSLLQFDRGGRARWKIENETFNTLKNQGYNFEHNYGHGNNNLSTVFAMLMMLAFLIDQIQQRCCGLFQAALKKAGSKKSFWEKVRAAFFMFTIDSWKSLFEGLTCGLTGNHFTPDTS